VDGLTDLPDVNVWLALSVPDHSHHPRARQYWYEESGSELAFCRVTALAFLRLTTQPAVMGGEPLTVREAWEAYVALRKLPEVVLAVEPDGCEDLLAAWAREPEATPRLWTDAYLAAFARAGAYRLVSFDSDFGRFQGLDLLRLEP
jgi:toxin-antitoxin system PIN domain toxin